MILGIDASSIRSGGGLSHLRGVLANVQPADYGFRKVVIWANPTAARYLADLASPTFEIRSFAYLNGSLPRLLYWHSTCLTREIRALRPDVLWVPAGIMGLALPVPTVMISQNLLPFEPNEAARYGLSKARIKIALLGIAQSRAFRAAQGVIFLTKYARDVVVRSLPALEVKSVTIPHGIDDAFFRAPPSHEWRPGEPIRLLYVSTVDMYKHQWNVVEAARLLTDQGHDVQLSLVGGAYPPAMKRLQRTLDQLPETVRARIHLHGMAKHDALPEVYRGAHLFVFASSCETMSIIVLEAMASGLPIACSNRGPMREILGDAGVYFDPENPANIANAVSSLIASPALRTRCATAAFERAKAYSWKCCAAATLSFLQQTAQHNLSRSAVAEEPQMG